MCVTDSICNQMKDSAGDCRKNTIRDIVSSPTGYYFEPRYKLVILYRVIKFT